MDSFERSRRKILGFKILCAVLSLLWIAGCAVLWKYWDALPAWGICAIAVYLTAMGSDYRMFTVPFMPPEEVERMWSEV